MANERPGNRSTRRYREVARVLSRHGLGYLVSQLGLGHLVPFHWGLLGHRRRGLPYTQAEHLRLAFEELGATAIKLGQILSTRADLLPPDYLAELAKLQDAVPPEPGDAVERQITAELGKPPSLLFAAFDATPLGSASIGQVHAARLHSGEDVVVKVQRPGVDLLIETDLAILADLARLAQSRTTWGQVYDFPAILEEFADTLRGELDYEREAASAERISRNFRGDRSLRVPIVYRAYSGQRVLTMERLYGSRIADLAALDEAGIDRAQLARTLAGIVTKMVLGHGFFHADPHPGNFLVKPGPVVGLLDYGIIGQFDENTRDELLFLFLAVLDSDMDRVVDRLVDLGIVGSTSQLERLKRDLSHLLLACYGRALGEVDLSRILDEFMAIARRHRLQVPARLTLLAKTMSMYEGMARRLDARFNMSEVLGPYARELALETYSPRQTAKRLLPVVADLSRLVVTLPRRLDRLSSQAERGNASLNVNIADAEHYLDDLNRMVNRLILAMLTTGSAVGLALLVAFYHPPGWEALLGWLFTLGFAVTVVVGAWLVFTIVRGKHH